MVIKRCLSVQHSCQVTPQLEMLLIDRLTDAVFCVKVKSNAKFLYVNDAACCLVGYSREELLCMSIENLNLEFLSQVWSQQWETLTQQGYLDFESLYQTQDGQKLPVRITITYKEGEEYAYILICDRFQRGVAYRHKGQSPQTPKPVLAKTAKLANPQGIFPNDPQLSQVFQFIESNYDQSISLSDVAVAVGYCPAYLTDLVRRQTGKTVNDWIVERRMVAARTLLLETNHCVSQIAQSTGYQHEGHFFRQFRQHHGTTPQAWRKEQRHVAKENCNN